MWNRSSITKYVDVIGIFWQCFPLFSSKCVGSILSCVLSMQFFTSHVQDYCYVENFRQTLHANRVLVLFH